MVDIEQIYPDEQKSDTTSKMKTYIGTKIIKAEPMSHEDWLRSQEKWSEGQETAGDGYMVSYPDGYISWSPKKVFEDAYLDMGDVDGMPPHQQRVVGEYTELKDKSSKLSAFILDNPIFLTLSEGEQSRLRKQNELMAQYCDVLSERISAF